MAMNKTEKKRLEDLEQELRIAKAFRWHEPVEANVPRPTGWNTVTEGYISHGYVTIGIRAEKGWSERSRHGTGPKPDPKNYHSGSQNGIDLYSTESKALRAARAVIVRDMARKLAAMDSDIEALEAAGA